MSSSPEQKHQIRYRQVHDVDDKARSGFIRVFQNAFGDAPYFEQTPDSVCNQIWIDNIDHCLWVVECDDCSNHVVGFACGHSLASGLHPDILEFIGSFAGTDKELPIDWRNSFYMSDFGVLPSHRRHGIGFNLIQLRREWAHKNGIECYVQRTASDGSHSRRLYTSERVGGHTAAFVQPVEGVDGEIDSASKHRIYHYGDTIIGQAVDARITW